MTKFVQEIEKQGTMIQYRVILKKVSIGNSEPKKSGLHLQSYVCIS